MAPSIFCSNCDLLRYAEICLNNDGCNSIFEIIIDIAAYLSTVKG